MSLDYDLPHHVMLDIETMGTDPYCPVVAIGACRFAMDEQLITDTFYQPISLESCMELGLKPSAPTIVWWLNQSQEAQDLFANKQAAATTLPMALDAFTDWLNSRPDQLWGNSARFDCGILEATYKVCSKVVPWEHWNERCYRTIKSLPKAKGIKLVRSGVYHNAMDDAISQANHLREIYRQLGF